MIDPADAIVLTIRIEVAQELVRRACEGGCCGIKAAVDNTTCLMAYPDHKMEWCGYCLMAAAADIIMRLVNEP